MGEIRRDYERQRIFCTGEGRMGKGEKDKELKNIL